MMDLVMILLEDKTDERKVWAARSLMVSARRPEVMTNSLRMMRQRRARVLKLRTSQEGQCTRVTIPVLILNKEGSNHWVAIDIDVEKKVLKIMDSLKECGMVKAVITGSGEIIEAVCEQLGLRGPEWEEKRWDLQITACDQQEDTHSCGVIVAVRVIQMAWGNLEGDTVGTSATYLESRRRMLQRTLIKQEVERDICKSQTGVVPGHMGGQGRSMEETKAAAKKQNER